MYERLEELDYHLHPLEVARTALYHYNLSLRRILRLRRLSDEARSALLLSLKGKVTEALEIE